MSRVIEGVTLNVPISFEELCVGGGASSLWWHRWEQLERLLLGRVPALKVGSVFADSGDGDGDGDGGVAIPACNCRVSKLVDSTGAIVCVMSDQSSRSGLD